MSTYGTEELTHIARDVATQLEGFTLVEPSPNGWCMVLAHDDGRELRLSWEDDHKGKLRVGVKLDHNHVPYGMSRPSIGVSASRGTLVIANEISRRLLPEYQTVWDATQARKAAADAYAQLTLETGQRVQAAFRTKPPNDWSPGQYFSVSIYESPLYGDAHVNGDSVRLTLNGLTVEQAEAIAKLVLPAEEVAS